MTNPAGDASPGAARALVIVGGTGDLAMRMLFPALYNLERDRRLPATLTVIAAARSDLSEDVFRERVREQLVSRLAPKALDLDAWTRFSARLRYRQCDMATASGARTLAPLIADMAAAIFYLAVSPSLYADICRAVAAAGLVDAEASVVLEKPLGRDLVSSRAIHSAVAEIFAEAKIFRIDHYLGKEAVQNLLALRFGNIFFEPLWNNHFIDYVQITIAESEGVASRLAYYNGYGALRDIMQNHMLQLLALVAMEPSASLDADTVAAEKLQVLRALKPVPLLDVAATAVRGQYTRSTAPGVTGASFADELGSASDTETFVAICAEIDNWRWSGVPFYLRTGRNLPERHTRITIQFKAVPHSMFGVAAGHSLSANRLVIELQPDEEIGLTLMNRSAGLEFALQPLVLSLTCASEAGTKHPRTAYEPLFLDILSGERRLFISREEVEAAWIWIDGIAEAWKAAGDRPAPYAVGTWGPAAAFSLIERSGRAWAD